MKSSLVRRSSTVLRYREYDTQCFDTSATSHHSYVSFFDTHRKPLSARSYVRDDIAFSLYAYKYLNGRYPISRRTYVSRLSDNRHGTIKLLTSTLPSAASENPTSTNDVRPQCDRLVAFYYEKCYTSASSSLSRQLSKRDRSELGVKGSGGSRKIHHFVYTQKARSRAGTRTTMTPAMHVRRLFRLLHSPPAKVIRRLYRTTLLTLRHVPLSTSGRVLIDRSFAFALPSFVNVSIIYSRIYALASLCSTIVSMKTPEGCEKAKKLNGELYHLYLIEDST